MIFDRTNNDIHALTPSPAAIHSEPPVRLKQHAMPSTTLTIDKKRITECEIVQITWKTETATKAQLTIDNGHSTHTTEVEPSGTKKFKLNRPGKTRFTLLTEENGKTRTRTVAVRVRKIKLTRATTVDDRGKRLPRWKEKWQQAKYRALCAWNTFTPAKRLAFRILLMLALLSLAISLFPKIFVFCLLAIMGYLVWFIYKH